MLLLIGDGGGARSLTEMSWLSESRRTVRILATVRKRVCFAERAERGCCFCNATGVCIQIGQGRAGGNGVDDDGRCGDDVVGREKARDGYRQEKGKERKGKMVVGVCVQHTARARRAGHEP